MSEMSISKMIKIVKRDPFTIEAEVDMLINYLFERFPELHLKESYKDKSTSYANNEDTNELKTLYVIEGEDIEAKLNIYIKEIEDILANVDIYESSSS